MCNEFIKYSKQVSLSAMSDKNIFNFITTFKFWGVDKKVFPYSKSLQVKVGKYWQTQH